VTWPLFAQYFGSFGLVYVHHIAVCRVKNHLAIHYSLVVDWPCLVVNWSCLIVEFTVGGGELAVEFAVE